MRTRPEKNKPPVALEATPSIVSLASQIAATEKDIGEEATRNVQIQMKLNDSTELISAYRKVLAGLHREMDRYTAGTRVH